jgi:hypothetical protein
LAILAPSIYQLVWYTIQAGREDGRTGVLHSTGWEVKVMAQVKVLAQDGSTVELDGSAEVTIRLTHWFLSMDNKYLTTNKLEVKDYSTQYRAITLPTAKAVAYLDHTLATETKLRETAKTNKAKAKEILHLATAYGSATKRIRYHLGIGTREVTPKVQAA